MNRPARHRDHEELQRQNVTSEAFSAAGVPAVSTAESEKISPLWFDGTAAGQRSIQV